ncbi:MAG: hypothetical protein NT127_05705 [Sphingobacteriales bacterium]|nr:hypothetical protein [Sphingobacteriales bacterium]
MLAKVNFKINLINSAKFYVELYDVDVIKDDLLQSKTIEKSQAIEFIFESLDSGEMRPELEIRIFDMERKEIYRSKINDTLDGDPINDATGLYKTTIDFGEVTI